VNPTYAQWRQIARNRSLPLAAVDLDAFDANVALFASMCASSTATIRVASKSIRSPELIRRILDADPCFQGVMAYAAHEAIALLDYGIDDILMAYPIGDTTSARALVEACARTRSAVILAVDSTEHVDMLASLAASAGITLPVSIDLDASLAVAGGSIRLGVRRSALRTAEQTIDLARYIRSHSNLRVEGIIAYEAQVAGLQDHNPSNRPLLDPVRRAIKRKSVDAIAALRAEVCAALSAEGHHLRVVNGGGTGSAHSTLADPSVTELTVGSGFISPHLFDGYDGLSLHPALFFVLPVCRVSGDGYITCASGGFIASGPPGMDRVPVVVAPPGLSPVDVEGWGEVQTPFQYAAERSEVHVGDPVVCRPAKAGELAERFASYALVRDGHVVGEALTYRGHGWTFL